MNSFRVAWQSALAAGLCLGFPAGLVLWLILLRELTHSAVMDRFITLLQTNGLNSILIVAFCSLIWSFLLSKISGYCPWWKIGFATILGILAGWFSPLSNLDGLLGDRLAVHTLHAVSMSGIVGAVTLCVGLAYGVLLHNTKAGLTMAFTTSFGAMAALVLTILLFDRFGIRVGSGNFAMSKVTAAGLLMSAMIGGMVLGLGFSRLVGEEKHPTSSAP